MLGDIGDKALGILVATLVTPVAIWILGLVTGLLKWRPTVATVQITAISIGSALAVGALIILTYDRFLLPLEVRKMPDVKATEINRDKHKLGEVIKNTAGREIFVSVSARNNTGANSMCAAVSTDYKLPQAIPTNCGNAFTVAAVSFDAATHLSSMTFVVPKEAYYMVTADGGVVEPVIWSETPL